MVIAVLSSCEATSRWSPCCTAKMMSIVDVMALAMFNALSTVNCLLPAQRNYRREWPQHWHFLTLCDASCIAEALIADGRNCCPIVTRSALQGGVSVMLALAHARG